MSQSLWYSYICSPIKSGITKIDLFAKQIKFNYKGQDSFKTLFGGCVSFVIFATILVYTVFLTNKMIQRSDANRTLSTKINDLQIDSQVHQPGLGNFKFDVTYTDQEDDPFYDETYFRIVMTEFEVGRVENAIDFTFNSIRDLEPELCDKELFIQNSLRFQENNTAIFWPKYNDYEIRGAYSSEVFKYLNISIIKWNPFLGHQNCKSSDEIDAKLVGGRFAVVIANSYVDFDDYENTIKTYIDDRFLFRVNPGIHRESILKLRNNHVKLADDFLQIGNTQDQQFYSVETSESDFIYADSNAYVSVFLNMEAREDTYERTVFSFFDLTGLVGGVFEILEITGSLFVSFFISRLYMFSMLNDLYQVQKIDSNHDFSKIIPKTKKQKVQKKRTKYDPKMFEETKTPTISIKNIDYSNDKMNSSSFNDISEPRNNRMHKKREVISDKPSRVNVTLGDK